MEGTLEKDSPLKIVHSVLEKNEIKYLVEWSANKDGITPRSTYYSLEALRGSHYNLLIDFFDSKMKNSLIKANDH